MVLFELCDSYCGNQFDFLLLSGEFIGMLHDFSPEPRRFRSQAFVFLDLGVEECALVLFERLFVQGVNIFLEDFVDELGYVLLKLICVFDVALNEDRKAEDASIVVLQAHDDVSELLLGPQVIEGWLLHERVSQILQYFVTDRLLPVLIMHNKRIVGLVSALERFLNCADSSSRHFHSPNGANGLLWQYSGVRLHKLLNCFGYF